MITLSLKPWFKDVAAPSPDQNSAIADLEGIPRQQLDHRSVTIVIAVAGKNPIDNDMVVASFQVNHEIYPQVMIHSNLTIPVERF